MRNTIRLIFFTTFAISIGCSGNTPTSQQLGSQNIVLDSIVDGMLNDCMSDSTVAVIIQKYYGTDISNFKILRRYISDCHLYWSDPGYKEGPNVSINDTCIVVSFTTTTYNDDGTERYKDDYSFSFPLHDSIVVYSNRYYGRFYHGGSMKIYKNDNDTRFSDIDKLFIHTKVPLLIELEKIRNK